MNIHDFQISAKSDTHESKKSNYLGSLIFREDNFLGKSLLTQNIHNVQISAVYDTMPRLMRQMMKQTGGECQTKSEMLQ